MLFDTHAHLDDPALYTDIDNVLMRAEQAGVKQITTIGCDWRSSLLAVHIAERYPQQVYAAIGVHPHEAKSMTPEWLEKLRGLAVTEKVVAWGEIGLDYYHDHSPREMQRRVFREHLAAARDCRLPVIIHDRDAHQDVMDILHEESAGLAGGILHCYSGSWEMAKQCLDLGFCLSFAGPLTYHNAKTPVEVASKAPLDMLLVETDCPYLSPHPFRGKTNEPARVTYTAAKLAEIRGLEYERLAEITTANARRIFNLL